MKPSSEDVQRMVSALMTLATGIERAKRRGLASVLATLQIINAHKRILPSTLSAELGLHQSSVTRQIQALEREGRVKTMANPDDGRSCFVELTSQGRRDLRQLTKFGLKRFALFVADWDAEEVRTLTRLMEKLEASKAKVAERSPQPLGRSWRRKADGASRQSGWLNR